MARTLDTNGGASPEQSSLEEELLLNIATQVKTSPVAISLAMGIIAYMIYRHLPDQPLIWGGWFSMVLLTQAYRIYRLPRLHLQTHIPIHVRTRHAARLNFVGVAIQSLSLLAFPMLTPMEASVQTMMFVGMGVGSIVTTVGWRPYSLSHIWLTLIPAYTLWLWSGVFGPSDEVGVMVGLVGYAYSFTLWRISQRLYQMNKDFFANRAALAVALDEAEAAGMAKTRFLAAASHDLRQPIHTLSLFSATMGMRTLDNRTREIAGNMDAAIQTLSTQLDALLDVSKLDAGIVPIRLSDISLAASLERLCHEVEAGANARDVSIYLECPGDAQTHTDPSLFDRVVRNVLNNAISHNRDCSVYVAVADSEQDWVLEIRDTGIGIPGEEQRKVFEEFYQLHNPERDRNKGLGLGLPIVKRLSTLLGMQMVFESEPGVGTRFAFRLPIASGDLPETNESSASTDMLYGLRILVVDDEPGVRKAMTALLSGMGCLIKSADSTGNAVAIASQWQPRIALVDLRLRDTDSGFKTAAQLRELYPELPVLLISGDTAPDRLREAEQAGIPLLSKPVQKDELCEAIAFACNL